MSEGFVDDDIIQLYICSSVHWGVLGRAWGAVCDFSLIGLRKQRVCYDKSSSSAEIYEKLSIFEYIFIFFIGWVCSVGVAVVA